MPGRIMGLIAQYLSFDLGFNYPICIRLFGLSLLSFWLIKFLYRLALSDYLLFDLSIEAD